MDLQTSRYAPAEKAEHGDRKQLTKLNRSCRQDMPGVLKSKAAFVPTAGKTFGG
jgi:hypothetical protein